MKAVQLVLNVFGGFAQSQSKFCAEKVDVLWILDATPELEAAILHAPRRRDFFLGSAYDQILIDCLNLCALELSGERTG
jgi:hypothetical protein